MSQSATKKAGQQEAIARLREWLKPGDTVYCVLRHVSRSGMQREISLKKIDTPAERELHGRVSNSVIYLDGNVAAALDARVGKHDGVVVGGCGMDMGVSLVYDLSRTLFPSGFGCVGEECPSNDHSNGDRDYTPHCGGASWLRPSGVAVRSITYHDRTEDGGPISGAVGVWGEYQPQGHRAFTPQNGELTIYLFDDEVDSDEPALQHWHTDGGYALLARWL